MRDLIAPSSSSLKPDVVRVVPDPVLRAVCAEVGKITAEARLLGERLAATMRHARGIGLAAPQIGVSLRAVAVGIPGDAGLVPLIMFDPEIIRFSDDRTDLREGCLSMPGRLFLVNRPAEVQVAFTGMDGRRKIGTVGGIVAKCVQHEIDHLDGVLISDRGPEVFQDDETQVKAEGVDA